MKCCDEEMIKFYLSNTTGLRCMICGKTIPNIKDYLDVYKYNNYYLEFGQEKD